MHPIFGPLGPLHPYKKKEDWPQNILKKKGVLKKKRDDSFSVLWKQQIAFCNLIFKMKRTFSKNPEQPKIPRSGILSDLCRNFTLISVWILSESLSECWSEFCRNFCLNFVVWILSEYWIVSEFVWILLSEVVWIFDFPYSIGFCEFRILSEFVRILSEFLSEFCLNFVWNCLNFVEFLSEFCLNFVWVLSELKQDTRKGRETTKIEDEQSIFPNKNLASKHLANGRA